MDSRQKAVYNSSRRDRCECRILFLVRIVERGLILPPPQLLPVITVRTRYGKTSWRNILFLGGQMFRKHFNAVLCFERPDKARVPVRDMNTQISLANDTKYAPQLASNSQVLATTHEGIALDCLSGGGNAAWVKVLLFTSSDSDKPTPRIQYLDANVSNAPLAFQDTRGRTPC